MEEEKQDNISKCPACQVDGQVVSNRLERYDQTRGGEILIVEYLDPEGKLSCNVCGSVFKFGDTVEPVNYIVVSAENNNDLIRNILSAGFKPAGGPVYEFGVYQAHSNDSIRSSGSLKQAFYRDNQKS